MTNRVDELFPDINNFKDSDKFHLEKILIDAKTLEGLPMSSKLENFFCHSEFQKYRFWKNFLYHTVRLHGEHTAFYILEDPMKPDYVIQPINSFFVQINTKLLETFRSNGQSHSLISYLKLPTLREIREDIRKRNILFAFYLTGTEKFDINAPDKVFEFHMLNCR